MTPTQRLFVNPQISPDHFPQSTKKSRHPLQRLFRRQHPRGTATPRNSFSSTRRKRRLGSLLMQFIHMSVERFDPLLLYLLNVAIGVYGESLEGLGVGEAFDEYFLSG